MQTVWKGAISFGLLNVPVKMGVATQHEDISFKNLHKKCHTPLQYKKFCPKCNEEVGKDDIIKGFEYDPGQFVLITEEDLEKIRIKTSRAIAIVDFVELKEVDPIYYDKTYYLWPEKGGEKPYMILRSAMEETGRVAVAKVAIRQKEHLCLVRTVGNALVLETMFYPDEIRAAGELGVDKLDETVSVRPEEMDMAVKLVENLTAKFEPEKYHDEYREELLKLIRAKVEGREVVEAEEPQPAGQVIDLMERLKASVEATQKKEEKPSRRRKSS